MVRPPALALCGRLCDLVGRDRTRPDDRVAGLEELDAGEPRPNGNGCKARAGVMESSRTHLLTRWMGRVALAAVLAGMYLPVLMTIIYSFNASRIGTVWTG